MSAVTARFRVSPAWAFLVLAAVLGVASALLTPPFQVPDEPQHFTRAFQASELPLFALDALTRDRATPSPYRGRMLPKSLARLIESSEVTRVNFRPSVKVDPAKYLAGLRDPLNPGDREPLGVTAYPAVAYVPQAIGIGAGRIFSASPLVLFYLGRLSALAVWAALVFLAIATTPILKWTFFLLGLMPMTVYVAASNSIDGLVIGAALLLSAQLLRWAYDPAQEHVGARDVACALVPAVALGLSKPPYLALLLLLAVVPAAKFGGRRRQLLAGAALVIGCVAAYELVSGLQAWTWSPDPPGTTARYGSASPLADVSPRRQIAFILEHPLGFAATLVNTFSTLHAFYVGSFVGVLGWLDTPLPPWVAHAYLAALVVVSLLGQSARVSWPARVLALVVFVSATVAGLAAIYIFFSTVGMNIVYGFQGRYFIPVAPMLFLLLVNRRIPWRHWNTLAVALVAFVTLTASVAGYRLVNRFYVAEVPSFGIDMLAASPAADFVVIKGWAVDRESGAPAAAVEVELDGQFYRARYGLDRPDVAERLKKPAYRYSGFEIKIGIAKPGKHSLALRIVSKDQTSYTVPEQKLPLLLR